MKRLEIARRAFVPGIALLAVVVLVLFYSVYSAGKDHETPAPDSGHPPAAPFPAGLDWLNVSRPLTLKDTAGRVVILDFWTYGCINCIHVMDDLRRLEDKYGDDLLVIGVHTPKFDNEKNLETLRRIIVRYDLRHPVVNDVDFLLARIYGMRAWPTQVVIDPAGQVLGKVVGEDNYHLLDGVITDLLEKRDASVVREKIPLALEKEKFAASFLAAPGKIAVSADRAAVADTLHHRVLVTDHQGKIIATFGGGEAGFADGKAEAARFRSPQGLVFVGKDLYVADTGNHSIRRLQLSKGIVTTVAGNGKNELHRFGRFPATEIGLRSPWALANKGNILFIAMAGQHQIWSLDLARLEIGPFAGDAREGLEDGPLKQASFSQPSGLSLVGDSLFVADAEDSAIRRIDLRKRRVETLIGAGLFEFGDRDGAFDQARLQHVLGIAAADSRTVYIADTYNHKVKRLDLTTRRIETVAGTGKPGKGAGPALTAALNEPGGLAMLGQDLLIADTNNNRVVKYDVRTRTISEWLGSASRGMVGGTTSPGCGFFHPAGLAGWGALPTRIMNGSMKCAGQARSWRWKRF